MFKVHFLYIGLTEHEQPVDNMTVFKYGPYAVELHMYLHTT
jgi:hypothetical protein